MDPQQTIGLLVLVSYFLLIFVLLYIICASFLPLNVPRNGPNYRAYTFTALTLGSFAHTWYYMFAFMGWSFSNYERLHSAEATQPMLERVGNWLANTGLFEEAWAVVCSTPRNWWWSEQLCLYTVGFWTVFLLLEGRRRKIKHIWAYMLLGQVVAISVAANLFYLALALSPDPKSDEKPTRRRNTVPMVLWSSILLSLATVYLVPTSIEQGYFLSNLLAMHVLLVIPLAAPDTLLSSVVLRMRARTLYGLIALASILPRIRTVSTAFASLPVEARHVSGAVSALWETLHSHPAQSSIGWDVVWTTASFFLWTFSPMQMIKYLIPCVLATSVPSAGFIAPFIMWRRSRAIEL